jgi:hypothetical protein
MPYALALSFFLGALLLLIPGGQRGGGKGGGGGDRGGDTRGKGRIGGEGGAGRRWAASGLYLAAFLSKSVAVTLPAVIVIPGLVRAAQGGRRRGGGGGGAVRTKGGGERVEGGRAGGMASVGVQARGTKGLGGVGGRLALMCRYALYSVRLHWGMWVCCAVALGITLVGNREGVTESTDMHHLTLPQRATKVRDRERGGGEGCAFPSCVRYHLVCITPWWRVEGWWVRPCVCVHV